MAGAGQPPTKNDCKRPPSRSGPTASHIHATNDLETALAADTQRKPLAASSSSAAPAPAASARRRRHHRQARWLGTHPRRQGQRLRDRPAGPQGLRLLPRPRRDLVRAWPTHPAAAPTQLPRSTDRLGGRRAKPEIADLAREVFAAHARRDKIATDILDGAASTLAKDACACARKLAGKTDPIRFLLAGSVLLKQPKFAAKVAKAIRARRPGSQVVPLKNESATWRARVGTPLGQTPVIRQGHNSAWPSAQTIPVPDLAQLGQAPTEQRHPRSMNLDRLPLGQAIDLFLDEDSRIPAAIKAEKTKLLRVVRWVVDAFKNGGRLFYSGAGTSGRLGVLDASECPPTFRAEPEQVQGIIAGGFPHSVRRWRARKTTPKPVRRQFVFAKSASKTSSSASPPVGEPHSSGAASGRPTNAEQKLLCSASTPR